MKKKKAHRVLRHTFWLKAGVVGGYTMLIITDLRIHLPPPPTGTPPSRRRRMLNAIDYQIILNSATL